MAGRSPARVIERTSTSSAPQARAFLCFCCDQLKKTFPLAQPCPAPQALKNTGPSARAEVLRVPYCSACLRRLPAGSRRPAGAVPQAPSARRRREIFGGGAGGGRFRGQRGGQGRNITFLVSPGITRSRQDASIECHIGGSIRPSSGCNGVHFALLNPLFFLSLCMSVRVSCAPQAGNFSRWGRRGSIWGSEGGPGRKMAICVTLCYTEISSRRVDRVPCWGVNSAVFGVQWGACMSFA